MSEPSPQQVRAAAGLTLTEALRTVGLGLEAHGVPAARLAITASGITVATETAYGRHDYSWNLLAIHSSAYQESRGAAARTRAADLARWSVLLRVVGQMLEADGVRECEIEGTVTEQGAPPPWRVAVRRDGLVRLRTEDVQVYVLRAEQQAAAQQANPAERSRGAPS